MRALPIAILVGAAVAALAAVALLVGPDGDGEDAQVAPIELRAERVARDSVPSAGALDRSPPAAPAAHPEPHAAGFAPPENVDDGDDDPETNDDPFDDLSEEREDRGDDLERDDGAGAARDD